MGAARAASSTVKAQAVVIRKLPKNIRRKPALDLLARMLSATPGTVTAVEALDQRGNNFLAAVFKGSNGFGLALTDITTGEFAVTELPLEALRAE